MIFVRPVQALARRTALMVASVPELTNRTASIEGTKQQTSSANSTSPSVGAPKVVPRAAVLFTCWTIFGCACHKMMDPHEAKKYHGYLPWISKSHAQLACSLNSRAAP